MQDNSVSARVLRIEVEPQAKAEGAIATLDAGLAEGSSPRGSATAHFDAERWALVLQDARKEGYNSASIVARGAAEAEIGNLVRACARVGLSTSLNVSPDVIERLPRADAELVQHWVLRLNAPGERATSAARMTAMLAALRTLSASRSRVSLAFHLDQTNLDDLPWAAWLAAEQAVSALTVETAQVHSSTAPRYVQSQLDVSQRVWAMLVLARACQRYSNVRYEIDLSDVNLVRREPERLLAAKAFDGSRPLAELVSPLVIDNSGKVSPLLATLTAKLALGNLQQASLAELSREWKLNLGTSFQRFCRQVHADVCENTALPFFNWAEYLQLQSRRIDAIVPRTHPYTGARNAAASPPKGSPSSAAKGNGGGLNATAVSNTGSWVPLRPSTSRLPELPWGPPRRARVSALPSPVQTPQQRTAIASRA